MSPVPSVQVDVELTEPPPVTTTWTMSAGTQVAEPAASHTPVVVDTVTPEPTSGGAQSRLTLQPWPASHWKQLAPPGQVAVQSVPPQSTSVSKPLSTWSLHFGDAQVPSPAVLDTVELHTPLAQSVLATQCLVAAQPLHVPPPQSRSVSRPFCLVSLQLAATQAPHGTPPGQVIDSEQTSLAQSSLLVQPMAVPQSWPLPRCIPARPFLKVVLVTVVVIFTLPTAPLMLLVSVMVLPAQPPAGQPRPPVAMLRPEPLMAAQMRHIMSSCSALFLMSMGTLPAPMTLLLSNSKVTECAPSESVNTWPST